jgi:hypothetical protein
MELWKSHLANPGAIIATRCHLPKLLECGYLAPYVNWQFDSKIFSDEDFPFITAGAGALFPSSSLHVDVLNTVSFLDLSFSTDDAWYWIHAIRNNSKVVRIDGFGDLNYIKGTQTKTLYWDGNAEIFNDYNVRNMARLYGLFNCNLGCHVGSKNELLQAILDKTNLSDVVKGIIPLTLQQSNLDRYILIRNLLQLEKSSSELIELKKSNQKIIKLMAKKIFQNKKRT